MTSPGRAPYDPPGRPRREPDLGDLVIVLLAGTLAGLRDTLAADGFHDAAGLVTDLVDVTEHYLEVTGA